MTLTQLKYIIEVTNSTSMNESARKLYISQPSLSSSIKELEKEIGIELFIRSNRGVQVTPEGKEFLGYARQIVEQYELVENRYIRKEETKKKFSVSMQHYTFAVNAFVELVKQYGMEDYDFAVYETKTSEVIQNVKNFRSEIGILYLNDFNRDVLTKIFTENNLEFHALFDCHVYAYLWKGHPLAAKQRVTLEELTEYPCLAFDQGDNNSFYYSE
ncbi:MAG: LysR family transcriptional regulator, partial [Eubacteriales bacterium]|nr:LysR family transcriptional regulator [Eubacteriales bacterium]